MVNETDTVDVHEAECRKLIEMWAALCDGDGERYQLAQIRYYSINRSRCGSFTCRVCDASYAERMGFQWMVLAAKALIACSLLRGVWFRLYLDMLYLLPMAAVAMMVRYRSQHFQCAQWNLLRKSLSISLDKSHSILMSSLTVRSNSLLSGRLLLLLLN